jgi:hypothetical protein
VFGTALLLFFQLRFTNSTMSSSTVEFVEQVLLHKKRGVGGVPLEVLQEKRGVGLQLHVFLGAEFVELDVFGTVELERSWSGAGKTGAEQSQTPP